MKNLYRIVLILLYCIGAYLWAVCFIFSIPPFNNVIWLALFAIAVWGLHYILLYIGYKRNLLQTWTIWTLRIFDIVLFGLQAVLWGYRTLYEFIHFLVGQDHLYHLIPLVVCLAVLLCRKFTSTYFLDRI